MATSDGRGEEGRAARGLAAAIALVGALIGTASSIVRGKVTAYALGPEGVGIAAEVLQVVTTALVPMAMLSGPALVKAVAEAHARGDRAEVERTYQSAVTGILGVAVVASLLASVVARAVFPPPWGASAWPLVLPAGLAAGLAAASMVPAQMLVSMGQLKPATTLQAFGALVQMVLVCAATLVAGLRGQFVALLLAAALVAPYGLAVAAKAAPMYRWRPRLVFDRAYGRRALAIGTTSLVTAFASQAAMSAVRVALEHQGGPSLNGQFQAAWAIGSTYFALLLGSLGNYAFPRYAAAETRGALRREVNDTAAFVLGLVPPALLAMVAFRDLAVWLLYNHRFHDAPGLLGLLTIGDAARAMVWVYLGPLLYRGKLGWSLFAEVTANAIFAGATWLLVPRVGLLGVGWAYAIMQLAALWYSPWVLWRACGVGVRVREWAGAIGTALLMLAAQLAMGHFPLARWAIVALALVWGWRTGLLTSVVQKVRSKLGR